MMSTKSCSAVSVMLSIRCSQVRLAAGFVSSTSSGPPRLCVTERCRSEVPCPACIANRRQGRW